MPGISSRFTAIVATERLCPRLVDRILRFRKALFVDTLGWDLPHREGRERDQFDTEETLHAALFYDAKLVGSFRAVRTDRPYLAREIFPHLASERDYPQAKDIWEISRFGVASNADPLTARVNYALMFRFAHERQARALVALADLTYERFLWRLGVRTRSYGAPQSIGHDAAGKPIVAVAGEIPLAIQGGPRFEALANLAQQLEIIDETLVFGRESLSA